jgi:RNA polymerase sigma factor (sigma-70 family)
MSVSDVLILMVEDDPDQVLIAKRALAKADLANPVRVVGTGEMAIAYLSGQAPYQDRMAHPLPAIILLDLKLPRVSGLTVLEWIRRQSELRNIPVAILTVSINPQDRRRADELGVSAYLCKPVDPEGLVELMKSPGISCKALGRRGEDAPTVSNPEPPASFIIEATPRRGSSRSDTEILGHHNRFEQTSWIMVRSASTASGMDALIRSYWKPLYFFVRQRGYDNETAKDIIQEFLAEVLERDTISKADPSRGRFRTFLLTALSNFMKDRQKAAARLKRGGGQATLSLDFETGERQYKLEASATETPEMVLNKAWARSTLERCISELSGRDSHLKAFRMLIDGADYAQIAQETGLTESAAKTAVHRLREQLRDRLLGHMTASTEDAEDAEVAMANFASLLR